MFRVYKEIARGCRLYVLGTADGPVHPPWAAGEFSVLGDAVQRSVVLERIEWLPRR